MADFSDKDLRNALGRFATGVTIVTTMTERGPLGITVNSFASVSLNPPLVLWSPARKSARFPAFEAASHFAVHVLAEDQEDIARAFAQTGIEAFDTLPYTEGHGRAPLIDGCVARFECAHAAGHDGGDHLIVVGEVLACQAWDRPPLLFYRGAFGSISHP